MSNNDDSESIDATFFLKTVPDKPKMEANHAVILDREMFYAALNKPARKKSANSKSAPNKKQKLQ